VSDTIELIKSRLAALEPEHVELEDDSAQHAGHVGAQGGGGHYNLTIVSPRFSGLSRVARHRLVYTTLGDLMSTRIHALAIQALSPNEL
jgi:BolA protein